MKVYKLSHTHHVTGIVVKTYDFSIREASSYNESVMYTIL